MPIEVVGKLYIRDGASQRGMLYLVFEQKDAIVRRERQIAQDREFDAVVNGDCIPGQW